MRFVFILSLVLLCAVSGTTNATSREGFEKWIHEFRKEAIAAGISKDLVHRALPYDMKLKKKVVKLDKKQPERIRTFEQYKANVINNKRIRNGAEYMISEKAILDAVSKKYGVEPQYLIALWGIETSFGRNTGGFSVIKALATLAYDGRRAKFFRRELINALKIIDAGHISLRKMKGSWAGAMGQCQFMPSSFISYAQDYDADGKKDIWNTRADVFASIANYLSRHGWKKGEPWAKRVRLPAGFDRKLIGLNKTHTIKFWGDKGVKFMNGRPLPADTNLKVSIIQPGGKGYKTYIAYDNYRIIMKWNRSLYFATSVGSLADILKVGG